jgi:hypothetical protein
MPPPSRMRSSCACVFSIRRSPLSFSDRCIELDPALGERVEKWRGRSGFIDYLGRTWTVWQTSVSPWQTVVMNELQAAMHENDLEEFTGGYNGNPDLLGESNLGLQVGLMENAAYKDRGLSSLD